MKLFFAHNVPLETIVALIKDQRQGLKRKLEVFDGFDRMVDESCYHPDLQRLYRLTILHGRMVHEARIRWCDEALRVLQPKKKEAKR